MQLVVKGIRQDVSFEDGDTTNFLILEIPGTGETVLAIIDDATVKRLVEVKAGLPPEPAVSRAAPSYPSPLEEDSLPEPSLPLSSYDGEAAAVFGGDVPPQTIQLPPPEPPPMTLVAPQERSVDQQLQEMREQKKQPPKYVPARTVQKDEYGYPIVSGLKKQPIVRDGDEDGIGQA